MFSMFFFSVVPNNKPFILPVHLLELLSFLPTLPWPPTFFIHSLGSIIFWITLTVLWPLQLNVHLWMSWSLNQCFASIFILIHLPIYSFKNTHEMSILWPCPYYYFHSESPFPWFCQAKSFQSVSSNSTFYLYLNGTSYYEF